MLITVPGQTQLPPKQVGNKICSFKELFETVCFIRPKKKNCLFPVTLPTIYFWPYPKSFYDILNQKHGIPNEKHEQLNCEASIYH